MPAPQLLAHDLYRSFQIGKRRIEVLRGVSLSVERGECLFLCGASGAGKTTLLYTLAGLERPESGEVALEGEKLYQAGESALARLRNRKMGFVFQGYFLLPELTALENVMLPGMIGRRANRKQCATSLAAVGLGERINHLPSELSGGEQQRVAIARALTNDPDIIFADEPTAALDWEHGKQVVTLLREAAHNDRATVLLVSHDPRIDPFADRLLHLDDGEIVEQRKGGGGVAVVH